MILNSTKKRVTVRYQSESHLISLPNSWDKLSDTLKDKFSIKDAEIRLLAKNGALISDIDVIREDDEIQIDTGCVTRDRWITLNVGGHIVQTTWHTLTKEKDSMLARMFDTDVNWGNKMDDKGAYLIDRSPKYFLPLLDYLRNGEIVMDHNINYRGVLLEAKYFGFTDLIPKIEELIKITDKRNLEPLNRDDVVRALMATPSNYILRFRGLNFSGADLSNLDLKHINFSHATLVGVNFTKSDLYGAVFDKADMTGATFDDAATAGTSMEGAILDNASMMRCDFEDTKLKPTSLFCAQLKNANLESSNLAGVNLRVANLKGSSLKNCSLRGACLAGADLEGVDLHGAELYNTNLRGANLTDVNFEDITTALHMTHMT